MIPATSSPALRTRTTRRTAARVGAWSAVSLTAAQHGEHESSHRHGKSDETASSLRFFQAPVLGEKAEMRAKLLPVHPWPRRRRRGSPHVHELRPGPEDDAPPGCARPVAQVDLLVVHEEAFVEA